MIKVLIINSGSSSMKFQVFELESKEKYNVLCKGLAERIFIDGKLNIEYGDIEESFDINLPNHDTAAKAIMKALIDKKIIKDFGEINAVGHRVVHGGEYFKNSVIVNKDVIDKIAACIPLAPLHNPGAITGIKAFAKIMPDVPMVCAFDTSFHTTIPDINHIFPVPYEWYTKHGVRRYGAHGISYKFIGQKLGKILNKNPNDINAIVCHLGNGASLCAIKSGMSYNTTMGLTPLGGLMMGTRSGDLDPSILNYMCTQLKINCDDVTKMLNEKSGFLGVSGVSSDARNVQQAANKNNKQAELALNLFAKRVADYIVAFQNDLNNNVDAIVFTAGIGENSSFLRQLIIDRVKTMKLIINEEKNKAKYSDFKLISNQNSEVDTYCIRTNEELMICHDSIALLKLF